MPRYRIKTFLFLDANNEFEAEKLAKELIGETGAIEKSGSDFHIQGKLVVRQGSAKLAKVQEE